MKYPKKKCRFLSWLHTSYFPPTQMLWRAGILHTSFLLPPLFAGALTSTELLNAISAHIINPLIFVLFAAAFLVFIWGLVQFVGNLDNEESRSQGVKHMIWGIVGMVVMVSVNGIIAIIRNTVAAIGGGAP